MADAPSPRIALLWRGESRAGGVQEEGRFGPVFSSLRALGAAPEPAVYAEPFPDEVREQLLSCDGVLVWVNPIDAGRDRSNLDAIPREVADAGIFVSAHPDIILKMGTKEVLCEINVSSVSPFPDEALPALARAGFDRSFRRPGGPALSPGRGPRAAPHPPAKSIPASPRDRLYASSSP